MKITNITIIHHKGPNINRSYWFDINNEKCSYSFNASNNKLKKTILNNYKREIYKHISIYLPFDTKNPEKTIDHFEKLYLLENEY